MNGPDGKYRHNYMMINISSFFKKPSLQETTINLITTIGLRRKIKQKTLSKNLKFQKRKQKQSKKSKFP